MRLTTKPYFIYLLLVPVTYITKKRIIEVLIISMGVGSEGTEGTRLPNR